MISQLLTESLVLSLTAVTCLLIGFACDSVKINRLLLDSVRAIDARVEASVESCSLRDIPFLEQRPLNTSLSVAKLQAAIAWPFVSMNDLCHAIARAEFAIDACGHRVAPA